MIATENIEYDDCGRMKYNPLFHCCHGKPFTEEELEYLCKYHKIDGLKNIALGLGRTEMVLANKICTLKRSAKYEYYKNLNKHY